MNILFLGTGAADWPPENTDNLPDFRRLSSILVDDVLLIDPGPQVIDALAQYGKNRVRYILNTHRHADHFSEETVTFLTQRGAQPVFLDAFEQVQLGPYRVCAYPANHSTIDKAVHFIICDGEKTMFYGLDGAWLMFDEVQAIRQYRPDLAVLDATIGDVDGDDRIFEHNNLAMVLEMQKTLKPYVKQFCISHMARTLHTDHQALAERMKPYEILVAHDGMEILL